MRSACQNYQETEAMFYAEFPLFLCVMLGWLVHISFLRKKERSKSTSLGLQKQNRIQTLIQKLWITQKIAFLNMNFLKLKGSQDFCLGYPHPKYINKKLHFPTVKFILSILTSGQLKKLVCLSKLIFTFPRNVLDQREYLRKVS